MDALDAFVMLHIPGVDSGCCFLLVLHLLQWFLGLVFQLMNPANLSVSSQLLVLPRLLVIQVAYYTGLVLGRQEFQHAPLLSF